MGQKSAHSNGPEDPVQGAAGPPYRLIDHEADLGFTVEARSLGALLALSALALHDVIADRGAARALRERAIDVEAADREGLLVRFLEEALHAFEVERLLFADVEAAEVAGPEAGGAPAGWRARATARGEPYDPARHELRRPVKAVTWHGLEVREVRPGAWRATVIVDL